MLARGPGGTGGASRTPLRSRLPRHFPWHNAINIDAARPRSDRKVSAGAFGFRKFSIRGMPKLIIITIIIIQIIVIVIVT